MSLRPLIRAIPTIAPVPHRSVLFVTGSQASEFLNGIIASSVNEPKKPLYSAFLHAQGKVLYDVFLYTHTNPDGQRGFLIDHDARAPSLLSLLKRYVLRSKVKIRDASEEYDVWASWGSELERAWDGPRQWNVARSGAIEPQWDSEGEWPWGNDDAVIRDRRAVGMGQRMLVRKGDRPQEMSTHNEASSDAYTLHRILHGVPEGITDIPSSAFPMESDLDVMGGLDFRKGCYVGQELTVRTYHTGVVRKRILPVVIHKPDDMLLEVVEPDPHFPALPPDLKISEPVGSTPDRPAPRARPTGRLLSSTQGVGLALLRYEVLGHPQRTDRKLMLDVPDSEQEKGTKWAVSYWWPEWWPRNPVEHNE